MVAHAEIHIFLDASLKMQAKIDGGKSSMEKAYDFLLVLSQKIDSQRAYAGQIHIHIGDDYLELKEGEAEKIVSEARETIISTSTDIDYLQVWKTALDCCDGPSTTMFFIMSSIVEDRLLQMFHGYKDMLLFFDFSGRDTKISSKYKKMRQLIKSKKITQMAEKFHKLLLSEYLTKVNFGIPFEAEFSMVKDKNDADLDLKHIRILGTTRGLPLQNLTILAKSFLLPVDDCYTSKDAPVSNSTAYSVLKEILEEPTAEELALRAAEALNSYDSKDESTVSNDLSTASKDDNKDETDDKKKVSDVAADKQDEKTDYDDDASKEVDLPTLPVKAEPALEDEDDDGDEEYTPSKKKVGRKNTKSPAKGGRKKVVKAPKVPKTPKKEETTPKRATRSSARGKKTPEKLEDSVLPLKEEIKEEVKEEIKEEIKEEAKEPDEAPVEAPMEQPQVFPPADSETQPGEEPKVIPSDVAGSSAGQTNEEKKDEKTDEKKGEAKDETKPDEPPVDNTPDPLFFVACATTRWSKIQRPVILRLRRLDQTDKTYYDEETLKKRAEEAAKAKLEEERKKMLDADSPASPIMLGDAPASPDFVPSIPLVPMIPTIPLSPTCPLDIDMCEPESPKDCDYRFTSVPPVIKAIPVDPVNEDPESAKVEEQASEKTSVANPSAVEETIEETGNKNSDESGTEAVPISEADTSDNKDAESKKPEEKDSEVTEPVVAKETEIVEESDNEEPPAKKAKTLEPNSDEPKSDVSEVKEPTSTNPEDNKLVEAESTDGDSSKANANFSEPTEPMEVEEAGEKKESCISDTPEEPTNDDVVATEQVVKSIPVDCESDESGISKNLESDENKTADDGSDQSLYLEVIVLDLKWDEFKRQIAMDEDDETIEEIKYREATIVGEEPFHDYTKLTGWYTPEAMAFYVNKMTRALRKLYDRSAIFEKEYENMIRMVIYGQSPELAHEFAMLIREESYGLPRNAVPFAEGSASYFEQLRNQLVYPNYLRRQQQLQQQQLQQQQLQQHQLHQQNQYAHHY